MILVRGLWLYEQQTVQAELSACVLYIQGSSYS